MACSFVVTTVKTLGVDMEERLALDQLMLVVDERLLSIERSSRKGFNVSGFLKTSTPTASRLSLASTPQRSVKQQLLDRDGWFISTGKFIARDAPEHVDSTIARHRRYARAEIAIVPYCVRHNRRFIVLLSRFSALLMDALTHQEFVFIVLWNRVHPWMEEIDILLECCQIFIVSVCDNDELVLGTGSTNIAVPSPLLCNIHLAIEEFCEFLVLRAYLPGRRRNEVRPC
ncbi:hypothetical protein V1527DRAFT_296900 [Lipomyces starkeyi]